MYFRKTSNQQYARTHTCRPNAIAYNKNVHKGREVGESPTRLDCGPDTSYMQLDVYPVPSLTPRSHLSRSGVLAAVRSSCREKCRTRAGRKSRTE